MELTFDQLCNVHYALESSGDPTEYQTYAKKGTIWLCEENPPVGGGCISKADIDLLANHPETEIVTVSGLHQDTFEYFIRTYGRQLRAIWFFKNKLVTDWSLLGTLPDLEYVNWFYNNRITSLWDMTGNTALKGLCISDFSRLHSLDGIEKAQNLRYFSFGDAVWKKNYVESLSPLAGTGITHLAFGAKSIQDGSLEFMEGMKSLEVFDFSANMFTTEQVAWAVANFPDVEGFALRSRIDDDKMWTSDDSGVMHEVPGTVSVGKRKPSLFFERDADRIRKYDEQFEKLKQKYKGMTYRDAFGG